MNEEEKKAIEKAKLFEYKYTLTNNDDKTIETLINLIDRLQKENTILKEIVNKNHETMINKRYVELNFISKDKIKEIVEKSYNDIDYFKRDIINDIEKLIN